MPISKQSVRRLSGRQREFLISHVAGPRQVSVSDHQTRAALLAKHLIYCDRPVRPHQTLLTSEGRLAVCMILAGAADALVAAGALDAEAAARVRAAIKARETRQTAPPEPEQISPVAPL